MTACGQNAWHNSGLPGLPASVDALLAANYKPPSRLRSFPQQFQTTRSSLNGIERPLASPEREWFNGKYEIGSQSRTASDPQDRNQQIAAHGAAQLDA
jgi:hypothetical protein